MAAMIHAVRVALRAEGLVMPTVKNVFEKNSGSFMALSSDDARLNVSRRLPWGVNPFGIGKHLDYDGFMRLTEGLRAG